MAASWKSNKRTKSLPKVQITLLEYATPKHEANRQMTKNKKKTGIPRSPKKARAENILQPNPESEVEAYEFIRRALRDLGWVVRNPSLNTGGQVWTQNQCFAHAEIKASLGGKRPENIIKLTESSVWVIEAKAKRGQLAVALNEATGYYADRINKAGFKTRAVLATGVAGSEEFGYLMKTMIHIEGSWQPVTINGQEATGLLSPEDVRFLLENKCSDIKDFCPPQWLFLQAAERINQILHIGGINKNDRAKTMAALLLSVVEQPPNLETNLPVLIAEINGRSEAVLKANGKPDFAPFVKILPPTNTTNHVKFKSALVRTIQELQNLNIRSAMNSSTDVLGQFYEVFLKYGNGAKEIGIVLTPRHITRFAVEAVGVSHNDLVLDPACGTGGFLVATFDHVRKTATKQQLERFKKYNLYGIEQESYIAVLSIVNMIFRGDGKNNITEGNCFTTFLKVSTVNGHRSAQWSKSAPKKGEEPIDRVLMNPPFALKSSIDKEYRFVSNALSLMADGGLLFSLLPLGAMFGSGEEKIWRRDELLMEHSLLAVITLPEELFYPAAQKQVLAIIIKKGYPHPKKQPVFWARIAHDGHIKVKSRRLAASELKPPRVEKDDTEIVLPPLRDFLHHPDAVKVNIPALIKTAPIDYDDPLLELVPEAYLDSNIPSQFELQQAVDDMVRETAAFLMRFSKESRASQYEID
ncbi:MAG: N-6 DNA methylase [candidate division Zixibacteria bacterium]|nr:N-6 DNA methylase [candidate division Zixibacteria bacterium]